MKYLKYCVVFIMNVIIILIVCKFSVGAINCKVSCNIYASECHF